MQPWIAARERSSRGCMRITSALGDGIRAEEMSWIRCCWVENTHGIDRQQPFERTTRAEICHDAAFTKVMKYHKNRDALYDSP